MPCHAEEFMAKMRDYLRDEILNSNENDHTF